MRNLIIRAILALSIPTISFAAASTCSTSWSGHVSLHETGQCGPGRHCHATNPNSTAIGCHQLTRAALQDLGWMDRTGRWLPNPYGIRSNTQFAGNMAAQDAALHGYSVLNWSRVSTGARSLIGTEVEGIRITEGGLLSAAHFLGPGGLNAFVECGMRPDCISDAAAAANGGRQNAHRIAMNRLAAGSAVNVSDITGFHTAGGGGRWAGSGSPGPEVPAGAFLPWSALSVIEVPPLQGERQRLR